MKKRKFVMGRAPLLTALFSMMALPGNFGVLTAQAAPTEVLQADVVHGTVIDETGETVIGATVVVKGGDMSKGTVTDFDGNFTIQCRPGQELVISYVGYETVTIAAKNGMKVQLKVEENTLQGVEVVAYGVQKKVTVTGALSSVKSEDLTRTPVSSVNNVLAGQLSGVTTIQSSGEPGADAARIFVRGQGTWVDSQPLIQVDGVEREMWDIDPNEIESITVLKDASATAVFGVRGANGVVLITTKRGAEGKAKISVNTSFSAVTPTKMVEQADSYGYANFYNQMLANDGHEPQFSQSIIQKFKDGSDPILFPSMKWDEYIMKDVTMQTQHNINISGGNKNVKYFISAGMMTQDGLFKEFDRDYHFGYQYQRFNYRSNLDINVTKTTLLSFNISGKVDDSDKPITGNGSAGMITEIYYATPFSSPGIVDGKYIINSKSSSNFPEGYETLPIVGGSPMAYYIQQPGAYHENNNKLQMDLILDQKLDFITKGLSMKLKGSYNSSFFNRKKMVDLSHVYTPVLHRNDDGTEYIDYRVEDRGSTRSYSVDALGKSRNWYAEGSFNYNRTFGPHSVTALALYNQSREYYISGDYSDIPRTYVGFVGRVTYDWNNRYMAEFNLGYNGSENFAPGKRFGTFPAGSIGWLVSDEPFFKPIKKAISFLKLRASWGLVGNDKIGGNRFMFMADPYNVNQDALFERIAVNSAAHAYNFGVNGGITARGAVESAKNNADVTWEKAFKQDYGFDMYFLNDRLRVNFDYYKEHRTNILWQDGRVPNFLGFTVPFTNFGIVDSWGWETSINWQDQIGEKGFRYWAKLNLSYNQNEIIEDRQAPQENEYMYTAGHRIGSRSMLKFWKYYYDGAEADYEREFGHPFPKQIVSDLKPGDAVYVDLDHNGEIDANDATREMGFTDDPQYVAGLTLGFFYQGFSFNAQLTGAWNVSRLLAGVFRRPFQNRSTVDDGGLLQYHIDHTWTVDNPSQGSEYPRATWENSQQNYPTIATSSLYEKDAKYLRLKTIQVAYDFKFPFMKKLGMNSLQLSLSGYNLLTFTPYIWGDPETTASAQPSYPLQRTYTASLKIGF